MSGGFVSGSCGNMCQELDLWRGGRRVLVSFLGVPVSYR